MRAQSPRHDQRRHAGHQRAALVVLGALLVGAVGLAPLLRAAQAAPSDARPFHVIVNPANPAATVDRAFVAQAFLKKVRRWPDGQSILPVDLTRDSAVRREWSLELLGRSVEAVKNYWQQLIFAGRDLPPPELPSESDVISYVLHNPGAIGYVSATAPLHGAKVLGIQ